MKLRSLLLIHLLAMSGCVSVGSRDFLVTPIGVVGVHSFAPQAAPIGDESVDVSAALREAARDDGAESSIRAVSDDSVAPPIPTVSAVSGVSADDAAPPIPTVSGVSADDATAPIRAVSSPSPVLRTLDGA